MWKVVTAATGLLMLPSLSHAQSSTQAEATKADATRVICRKESVTGSRLGARKRCMAASEWAETARLDRQSLERIQNTRYKGNEFGSGAAVDPFGRLN